MSSVNEATLIGRLGRDPESRNMQNGDAICNISLATSEKWKDKASGDQKESTEWHRVVFYGRLAEVAGQYLKKGALVYVKGKIKTRKWSDKDGVEKYTTEIHGHELKMLSSRDDDNGGSRPSAPAPAPRQQGQQRAPAQQRGGYDDDIPF